MKKALLLAICLYAAGCYAPLNNSGTATNKAWLEIPAKRTDFNGKQYDSCYQFRLHFVPAEAAAELDLQDACIDACCWRSDKEEVVLDFNRNFEQHLKFYGRAEKYTPGTITLKVGHSSLLNTTAVHVSPRGAIRANGTVKLKQKTVEDPARLAQLQAQSRRQAAYQNALHTDRQNAAAQTLQAEEELAGRRRAQELVQRTQGAGIDQYFYQLNQSYKQKGWVFFIGERAYQARQLADGTYRVTCRARVQTGTDADHLQSRTLSCGVWSVQPLTGTVSPQDGTARQIKATR